MNGAHSVEQPRAPRHFPSLWPLALPLGIWALHFLVVYVTAAIWHAKAVEPTRSAGALQATILVCTGVALVALAVLGCGHARTARAVRAASTETPGAEGAARRAFTGRLGVLLAGLGAVAVVFTQLAVALGGRW